MEEENPLLKILQNLTSNVQTETETNSYNNNNNNNNFNIMDILGINKTQNTNNFDISNIMKIQKILSNLNTEDPRKNLLTSIKPFLRTSRQDKVNEYITYLSIISAISGLNDKKE